MTSLLLLLTYEIPNPSIDDTSEFYNNSLFVLDKIKKKMHSINLGAFLRVFEYNHQKVEVVTKESHDKAYAELISKIDSAILTDVLNGNCELLCMMCCTGGYSGTTMRIRNTVRYLNTKGASSKIFVYGYAMSAGFIIAGAFNEKYCLNKSEFMFHYANINPNVYNDTEADIDDSESIDLDDTDNADIDMDNSESIDLSHIARQEVEEHLNDFFTNCNEDTIEECLTLKQICIDNVEADTYYSGKHLHELGIIDQSYDRAIELTEKFEKELGIQVTEGSNLYKLVKQLEQYANLLDSEGVFVKNESPFIQNHDEYQSEE